MIVLAILLWYQVVISALLTGGTVYFSAKEPERYGPSTAWFSGVLFGGFTAISATAAIVVGGLA